MYPVGVGNTRISTDYVRESLQTLVRSRTRITCWVNLMDVSDRRVHRLGIEPGLNRTADVAGCCVILAEV